MTGNTTDGQVDQLVKARWLALGLSQKDLAEVLGGRVDGNGMKGADLHRLRQVADALGIPGGVVQVRAGGGTGEPCARDESLQSLLELRLLRLFREVRDHNTKRMLLQLTEQIVRRQAPGHGDAG